MRQKELEGTQVAEQEAKAKVIRSQATADAFATETQAEANAKQIRIEGTARAEAQTRLAAAFADHGQELLAQAVIEHLPTMAGQFATAIGNIDQLTVFDGADGVTNQANAGLAETLTFIKQATGVDITDVINQRAKGMTTVTGKLPVELQQAADKLVKPLKGNEQHE
ncbi:flotillin family protein [Furfurilactobacillus entadae]|uniref:flotillin n=1 Tax=Furfurilactobacillus entadae TaxID=2922307 RepID=UPI0035EBFEBE